MSAFQASGSAGVSEATPQLTVMPIGSDSMPARRRSAMAPLKVAMNSLPGVESKSTVMSPTTVMLEFDPLVTTGTLDTVPPPLGHGIGFVPAVLFCWSPPPKRQVIDKPSAPRLADHAQVASGCPEVAFGPVVKVVL